MANNSNLCCLSKSKIMDGLVRSCVLKAKRKNSKHDQIMFFFLTIIRKNLNLLQLQYIHFDLIWKITTPLFTPPTFTIQIKKNKIQFNNYYNNIYY
jgi:hypothetical protein